MSTIIEDPQGSGEYTIGPADALPTARWALPADVLNITGVTVDVAAVDRAVATLETIVGLIEAVPRTDISDRDRHYLKLMTCYQAAFMADNPDLFTRNDVTSASQDGASATYRNSDSHLLAPLARRAYRKLSWNAKRVLVPGGGSPELATSLRDVNSEAFDDALPWSPV